MHDRNSYKSHRPICKRDAAAPGRGQGEIEDLAPPAACQERKKKKQTHKTKNPSGNQEAAGTLRSCPKEGCGCTRQTVAAGFPGTRVAPGKSVFLSLYFSSLPPSLSQHPRSRSRAFVPSFRLASFRLVVLGGLNPSARGGAPRGAGAPSPVCRRGRRCSEKSRVFLGRGEEAFHPAVPSAFHSHPLVPGSVMALGNPSGTAGDGVRRVQEGSRERLGREKT